MDRERRTAENNLSPNTWRSLGLRVVAALALTHFLSLQPVPHPVLAQENQPPSPIVQPVPSELNQEFYQFPNIYSNPNQSNMVIFNSNYKPQSVPTPDLTVVAEERELVEMSRRDNWFMEHCFFPIGIALVLFYMIIEVKNIAYNFLTRR